jgi:hypothetical protein
MFFLCLYSIGNSQDLPMVGDSDTTTRPIATAETLYTLAKPPTVCPPAFYKEINRGRNLAIAGSVMFYGSYFVIPYAWLLMMSGEDQNHSDVSPIGLSVFALGFLANVVGPIVSCSGTSVINNLYQHNNLAAPETNCWRSYGTGWMYCFVPFLREAMHAAAIGQSLRFTREQCSWANKSSARVYLVPKYRLSTSAVGLDVIYLF